MFLPGKCKDIGASVTLWISNRSVIQGVGPGRGACPKLSRWYPLQHLYWVTWAAPSLCQSFFLAQQPTSGDKGAAMALVTASGFAKHRADRSLKGEEALLGHCQLY